jgi:hypothetical protein
MDCMKVPVASGQSPDRHRNLTLFAGLLLYFTAIEGLWCAFQISEINEIPGATRDDVFYDNIAWHVLQGDGFKLDFQTPEWRQVYEEDNLIDGRHDWFMDIRASGPTTTRPPLPILVAAGIYRVFGWRWDVWRILFILLNAAVFASIGCWLARRFSHWAAFFFAGTISLDFSVMTTAAHVMTEALTIALVALLLAVATASYRQTGFRRVAGALMTGAVYGAVILARPHYIFWLPVFVLLTMGMLIGRRGSGRRLAMAVWAAGIVAGMTAVALPWWSRNCEVSANFNPLGSGGMIGLAGANCDKALADFGRWKSEEVVAVQNQSIRERNLSGLPLAEQEYWMGIDSWDRAMEWARTHAGSIPKLIFYRIAGFWGLLDQYNPLLYAGNIALLLLAIFGWTRLEGPLRIAIGLAVVATVLGVLLTWDDHGRYSIPLRPWIHAAAAAGAISLITQSRRSWAATHSGRLDTLDSLRRLR